MKTFSYLICSKSVHSYTAAHLLPDFMLQGTVTGESKVASNKTIRPLHDLLDHTVELKLWNLMRLFFPDYQ